MKILFLPAFAAATLALPVAAGTPAPDPLDARVAVPPAVYPSPMARGRSAEAVPVPWRDANERVNRIGGWRAYNREAAQPEAAPAPAAARPASAPTVQHHRHGGPR